MITQEAIQQACEKLVYEYGIQHERLLERQIAWALHQAIVCGDFVQYVLIPPGDSKVIYLPFHESGKMRAENAVLKKRIEYLENDVRRLEAEALERSTW